jgi:hypothetical protein
MTELENLKVEAFTVMNKGASSAKKEPDLLKITFLI